MLEKQNIQSRDFKNVLEGGEIVGFQIPFRATYYRGLWLTQLRPATVTVDGEKFEGNQITWTINGKKYEQVELANYPDVNWNIQDLAIFTVRKPGGLKLGLHDIEVQFHFSASYLPPRMDTGLFQNTFNRRLVLIG